MNKLAPGERSGWAFGRSDEELRPMFELIRQGKMPESKSMLGKLLNNMLTTEDGAQAGHRRASSGSTAAACPASKPSAATSARTAASSAAKRTAGSSRARC